MAEEETFLEFYNRRRNRQAFTDKITEAIPRVHHVGRGDNPNTPADEGEGEHYTFGRYSFSLPADQPDELLAAFAIWVKRQTIAGDEVGEYVRPTVENA